MLVLRGHYHTTLQAPDALELEGVIARWLAQVELERAALQSSPEGFPVTVRDCCSPERTELQRPRWVPRRVVDASRLVVEPSVKRSSQAGTHFAYIQLAVSEATAAPSGSA